MPAHDPTTPGPLVIEGARTHNLRQIDLTLPANRLVIVTGVSGSGKSSLAFDTIYAEGQRRYVESLSAYARQFLERMEKPDVDRIDGVSPAIAIRQKNTVRNPRSTVATTTEIHDYLRLLYARVGRTVCRECGQAVERESAEIVARRLAALPEGTRLIIGFEMPVVASPANGAHGVEAVDEIGESDDEAIGNGGAAVAVAARGAVANGADPAESGLDPLLATVGALRRQGFGRLLVGDEAVEFETFAERLASGGPDGERAASSSGALSGAAAAEADGEAAGLPASFDRSTLRVVVDRVVARPEAVGRLTDSVETAYAEGGGAAFALEFPAGGGAPAGAAPSGRLHRFSERFECRSCGLAYEDPQPRLFSFNNPFGACPTCHGFGNVIELDLGLVVPDPSLTLREGAIEPWSRPHYRAHLADLKRAARRLAIRLDTPWDELTAEERRMVVEGDGGEYPGVRGFFDALERKKYKVHVRVFLSRYRGYQTCPSCGGSRLRREARGVLVGGRAIDEVSSMTVLEAERFFESLALTEKETAIASKVLAEIRKRLRFLRDVGLDYLTLDRLSSTLSGGEAQRINLATALGSALVGTLYVLDEPSIGLHPRDNGRLIAILQQLRDQGNTVIVVEHDADMIRVADYVVDLGPGAGEQGGRVVYAGPLEGLVRDARSLTARYLRGELGIPIPTVRHHGNGRRLRVCGAREHNLRDLDVEIPLGTLTCVTGVSGSGKSTLVHDIIYPAIKRLKGSPERKVGALRRLEGAEAIGDAVLVDQAPIGRTPRSNPVTYLKAFDPIREAFAATKDARVAGLTASDFSFNVPGGRCEACEGEGQVRVEMQFLADVFVPCEVCDGRRFKPQVLEVKYRGKSVHQVLELTVHEALTFFAGATRVLRRLHVLDEIGLGYLRLGQPATTLSGGEAQRIKIAAHLSAHAGERLLYILDEPTTGLHFDDIAKLLAAFRKLLHAGHSLLVIEHNLDVIKTADWVIDLGPEGGDEGGRVVVAGTPEQVAACAASHTGRALAPVLSARR